MFTSPTEGGGEFLREKYNPYLPLWIPNIYRGGIVKTPSHSVEGD